MRRKNATNVYINKGVMKIYRSIKKSEEMQKKTMSEVRGQAYAELYQKLDTKKDENNVYKMAKVQDRKIRDFNQIKCIKDESDRLLVKDEDIKNR
jgi:ribosomal protein L20A (L18A)